MTEPTIMEMFAAKTGYTAERDPHTLTLPMRKAKLQPECHCPPPAKNMLGGQVPAIDRAKGVIRCRSCLKPIPTRCKRRNVLHLRGLLNAPEGRTDWASIRDLLIG